MNWQETVKSSFGEEIDAFNFLNNKALSEGSDSLSIDILCQMVAKVQAESSFGAGEQRGILKAEDNFNWKIRPQVVNESYQRGIEEGRREVVEWLKTDLIWAILQDDDRWQAKLESWGIEEGRREVMQKIKLLEAEIARLKSRPTRIQAVGRPFPKKGEPIIPIVEE